MKNDNSQLIGLGIIAVIVAMIIYYWWQFLLGGLAIFGAVCIFREYNKPKP